ncbi:MAG: histidinol-phosphate transaminase [Lachnospiraceae bacterium]|nr:histidinol-phosphate transaminase [Lachnospiraceae bacterium]
MNNNPLRLEQYETVLFNLNLNPLGIPESVTKALSENLSGIGRYPDDYHVLKDAIADYAGCLRDNVVLGTGATDLLRLFIPLIGVKKAMLLTPSCSEYDHVLQIFGCEISYYELSEKDNYVLDADDFIKSLDASMDLVIIGNPNNPTSQIVCRDDIARIADACAAHNIFLVIDEMYIEFTDEYKELTAVPLIGEHENIAVLRSISKFFAVPGLRFAYAIMNNPELMTIVNMTSTPNSISTLTTTACTCMFKDSGYISESRSQIHTERNLIYSAMSTNKQVKIYKPYANYALIQILKPGVTAKDIAEKCRLKGLIIRDCSDIHGLDERFIRICFMNPKQNDLLVNTILEQL